VAARLYRGDALRRLVVQPPADPHPVSLRALGERTEIPHGSTIRAEAQKGVDSRAGPVRRHTSRVVDAARNAIRDNRVPSEAGRRFWEFSGGIIQCGVCSHRMETRSILARSKEYHRHGKVGCANNNHFRTEIIESPVRELVSSLLQDPKRLRERLEEMIEAERAEMRGDPEQEAKVRDGQARRSGRQALEHSGHGGRGSHLLRGVRGELRELEETRKTTVSDLDTLKRRRISETWSEDRARLLDRRSLRHRGHHGSARRPEHHSHVARTRLGGQLGDHDASRLRPRRDVRGHPKTRLRLRAFRARAPINSGSGLC
jgi:uncharacterized Zn finger protein (UPF0148 family)